MADEATQEGAEKGAAQVSAVKEGKAEITKEQQIAQMGSSSQNMHPE